MRCPSYAEQQRGREQKPNWRGEAHGGSRKLSPSWRPEL
jgi:hypothetical protein